MTDLNEFPVIAAALARHNELADEPGKKRKRHDGQEVLAMGAHGPPTTPEQRFPDARLALQSARKHQVRVMHPLERC